jgi:hypothetical protein
MHNPDHESRSGDEISKEDAMERFKEMFKNEMHENEHDNKIQKRVEKETIEAILEKIPCKEKEEGEEKSDKILENKGGRFEFVIKDTNQ